jgi:hypothetical protein
MLGRSRLGVCLLVGVVMPVALSRADDDDRAPHGKAPVEVLVERVSSPAGIAPAPDGTLFFTDEKKGTLNRRNVDGTLAVLFDRLKKPRGLVRAADGSLLLVADELRPPTGPRQKGVLLRWTPAAGAVPVLTGLRQPQQLVLGPRDVAVSTGEGLQGDPAADHDDDDDDHDDDDGKGVVYRVDPAGVVVGSARGFDDPSGVWEAGDGTLVVAAAKHRFHDRTTEGNLFAVDAAGAVRPLVRDRYTGPSGVARDALGAFFLAAELDRDDDDDGGRIQKVLPDGRIRTFAEELGRPWGLAFDAAGHLYVSDAKDRRIYRFRAPAAPALGPVPPFTNHPTITLSGTAEPGAGISVLGGLAAASALADATGLFRVEVPLTHDAANTLVVYATGRGGDGLTGPPATATILQDSTPPSVLTSVSPTPNGFGWNNTDVSVSFRCSDDGSGVATCPSAVTLVGEGVGQVVQGTASDRAGNVTTVSVTVNIDKTPPTAAAAITPAPNAAGWNHTDVSVGFVCADALSGVASCPSPQEIHGERLGEVVGGTVTDRAGNTATSAAIVRIDETPPGLRVASPLAGSIAGASPVHVEGSASDSFSGLAAVACNGTPAAVVRSAFACDVPLPEGVATLSITAVDIAGGQRTAVVPVIVGAGLPFGRISRGLALADFDGDGRPDLAAVHLESASVGILIGRGDGTFTERSRLLPGGLPVAVVAGDLDGDGRPDLATADLASGAVSVFHGAGDGTFASGGSVPVGPMPVAVAMADVDRDGRLDLITANFRSGDVSTLLGHGDGTFAPERRSAAGGLPSALAVGDLDRDGVADLVTANLSTNDVSVLRGRGDGTFALVSRTAVGRGPAGVAIGDVNGDGIRDVITVNADSADVSVLIGRGDGTFAAERRLPSGEAPVSVALADLNRDGLLDIATTNAGSGDVSVLFGRGDGTFGAEQRFAGGSGLAALAVGDFDGNGQPDIALLSEHGTAAGLLGVAGGGFQTAAGTPRVTTLRDNGPSSKRADLVILGDGYTAAEMGKYAADVENVVQGIFDQEPFREYRRYFNVHRIDVESNESGVDHPERTPPVYRDTAFDSTYECPGPESGPCLSDGKVYDVVNAVMPGDRRDIIVVIMNDTEIAGHAQRGGIAQAPVNADVVLHEMGHSVALLGDEYPSGTAIQCLSRFEPWVPNLTRETERARIKWRSWIDAATPIPTPANGPDVPGLYEGGTCATGIYRPTPNSKMRTHTQPFGPINSEQLVLNIYKSAPPIEASAPDGARVTMSQGLAERFRVTLPRPATHSLDVLWMLDGSPVGQGAEFTYAPTVPGTHTLVAQVKDATAMVRDDPQGLLLDSRGWTVDVVPGTFAPDPHMAIDTPGPGATLTLPFRVEGWAIDAGHPTGTGVDEVDVWAFPKGGGAVTSLGSATLGIFRHDIGQLYGARFALSGYRLDVGALGPGDWTIQVFARSTVTGTYNDVQSVDVTVLSHRAMAVDQPVSGNVLLPFVVEGWAIDQDAPDSMGSGVDQVHVRAKPEGGGTVIFLGEATLGLERLDVGFAYGNRFRFSGYRLYATASLTPGRYTLQVSARSALTGALDIREVPIVVLGAGGQNPPASDARMSVDNPPEGATIGTSFAVWGYAVDLGASSGTGVDRVDVWAVPEDGSNPTFLGHARLGLTRDDIAAAFGERFRPSGYALDVSGLAAGHYAIQVSARSTVTGTFNDVRRVFVVVSGDGPPPQNGLGVRYRAHVQDNGWMDWVNDGATAGTTGQSLRMEAVEIELRNAPPGARVCYEAHVQDNGWMGEVCDGDTAGTTGQGLRMEALKVRLRGGPSGTHVCYQAHVENKGWMDEVCDGDTAGTTGQGLRMEAVKIRIRH